MTSLLPTYRRACALLISCALIFSLSPILLAHAASFTDLADTPSNTQANLGGVHHVLTFTTATTGSVAEIGIQFMTTAGSGVEPSHMDVSGATLGTTSGIGSGWSLSISGVTPGLLTVSNAVPYALSTGDPVSVDIQNITNPAIKDCNSSTDTLTDTCYVKVTTYDNSLATIDSSVTSFDIFEDPYVTFEIAGMSSGTTHNGITANGTSTSTTLPFGTLDPGQVVYLAHKLTIATNAPHGYTVNMQLANPVAGVYSGTQISPFGATSATWSTPQSWSSPNGTVTGTNTGWFGANTTDTRISGWSSASAKFGPVSAVSHPVAQSTSPEVTPFDAYVTYAIEVNGAQTADLYQGTLTYNIETTY